MGRTSRSAVSFTLMVARIAALLAISTNLGASPALSAAPGPIASSGNNAQIVPTPTLTPAIRLCSNVNYGGFCEVFTSDDPDLSDNPIGDNQVSSLIVPA